jgi:hypothetical protein
VNLSSAACRPGKMTAEDAAAAGAAGAAGCARQDCMDGTRGRRVSAAPRKEGSCFLLLKNYHSFRTSGWPGPDLSVSGLQLARARSH